jgi:3-isopropylmalate/(R)-2-methylmalate dehydratase small subunit
MQPFTRFESTLAVMANEDVDTDQIIPARFLTTTTRAGLGRHCFADRRLDADGRERADFPLNAPAARGAGILLAGRNFGCGSSREHAPWALLDYGIRAVVSTRIADIFRANALKNGLLPIEVDAVDWARLAACAGRIVAIDLAAQRIELPAAAPIGFAVEPFARYCLLRGIDQLEYLVAQGDEIARHEARAAAPARAAA